MIDNFASWPNLTLLIFISIISLLGEWEWKSLMGGKYADKQEERYPTGIRRDLVEKAELFDQAVDRQER